MKTLWPCLLLFSFISCCHVFNAKHSDEIKHLPGLREKVKFRQYSGYLNGNAGKHLHYWFTESQSKPSKDPVVLWLNGGPGCSSLGGLLTENGPFQVKSGGTTLGINPFSWNRIANVLFLESPPGVGFSYSDDKNYSTNDDATSLNNYLALEHFYKKFPHFKKNDFYITGESYGGVYVPTLGVRLLNSSFGINFKGFAIGNGYLDVNKLSSSLLFFLYHHGLIGSGDWKKLTDLCCTNGVSRETCQFSPALTLSCTKKVKHVFTSFFSSGVNMYDIYANCSSTSFSKYSRYAADMRNLLGYIPFYDDTPNSIVPCVDERDLTHYLNQKSVRAALHIPQSVPTWEPCSDAVSNSYRKQYMTMTSQVLKLYHAGKRGLIYNGDVDTMCNFLGDQWFADSLRIRNVQPYRKWTLGNQVGGFYESYTNLTFLTIKGSGHMVPSDAPSRAFHMFSSFLNNKPY